MCSLHPHDISGNTAPNNSWMFACEYVLHDTNPHFDISVNLVCLFTARIWTEGCP